MQLRTRFFIPYCANECMSIYRHGLRRFSVPLLPGPQAWVFARPELAGMAIGNLLRNACHYTEQGEIRVLLKPGSLVIEDTGPGLPRTVRDQLFERFVRGDNDDEIGAGLGLAIVKRICEHLGWDIRLEDRAGGGSRFVLTFPR